MALDSNVLGISDRHAAYVAGWPCSLAATATQGRHLIAVRDFACGETVLVSEAYIKALLPSHKKRICSGCMHDGGRRLPVHCSGCGEAWYCSTECRTADASGAAHQGAPTGTTSVPRIPHNMLCPVLAHFGGLKVITAACCTDRISTHAVHQADADMECVLRMCLDLAALQRLSDTDSSAAPASGVESQPASHQSPVDDPPPEAVQLKAQPAGHGSNSISTSSTADTDTGNTGGISSRPPLPVLTCSDFQLLQCHPVAVSERDAQQWRKCLSFLHATLQRTEWPQPPSVDDMLQWAGRVAANSFSRYSERDAGSSAACASDDQHQQGAPQQQTELLPADGRTTSTPTAGTAPQQQQQQQQQTAEHGVQSQLQRLQLAQRSLWEGSSAERQVQGATSSDPPSSTPSGSGSSQAASGVGAPPSDANSCVSNGTAEQSAAQQAAVHAEPSLVDQPSVDVLPATGAGTPEPANGTASGTAAHPCGIASAGASAAVNAQPVGRDLFITASYFNHSCQPNCIIHRRGSLGTVTAQSSIKAGDELCISYIDLDVPRSARQALLHRMFHFACNCERCQQELAEGSAKCSYSASGSAAAGSSRGSRAPKRRGRKARVSR